MFLVKLVRVKSQQKNIWNSWDDGIFSLSDSKWQLGKKCSLIQKGSRLTWYKDMRMLSLLDTRSWVFWAGICFHYVCKRAKWNKLKIPVSDQDIFFLPRLEQSGSVFFCAHRKQFISFQVSIIIFNKKESLSELNEVVWAYGFTCPLRSL